jgi:hypothetical protein
VGPKYSHAREGNNLIVRNRARKLLISRKMPVRIPGISIFFIIGLDLKCKVIRRVILNVDFCYL